jgi:hypothetical protein
LRKLLDAPAHQHYQLSVTQQQQAASTILLQQRNTATDKTITVSLLDVYQRESIQGLSELHGGNHDYLMQRARELFERRAQLNFWQQQGLLDAVTLAGLQRLVRDKQLKQRWMLEQGLTGDMHHESAIAEARWRHQPEATLKRYYDAHPEQFQQVQQVEGEYLTLSSQQLADQIYQQLKAGQGMAALATEQQLPLAQLKLVNDGRTNPLAEKLALLQKTGLSRPFRAGEQWLIFNIRNRQEGLLPFSDESVRHSCARAVAHEQAQAEFDALRKQLRQNATITELAP